jgi:hypothetical protein
MVWHELYPERPRPQILEEIDLAAYMAPSFMSEPTVPANATLKTIRQPVPVAATPVEDSTAIDRFSAVEDLIRCKKLLSELWREWIPVTTSDLARLLGVSTDYILRQAKASSPDGDAFRFMGAVFFRSPFTFQQEFLWNVMTYDSTNASFDRVDCHIVAMIACGQYDNNSEDDLTFEA